MTKPTFTDRLSEDDIPLDYILLDPNNPRLIGVENYYGVPEERIAEPDIQDRTLGRLNSTRAIDQESLRASIQQSGLLPVDRVVVRPTPHMADDGKPYYVVVEGNRRIAACKTLVRQHQTGEKTLDEAVRTSIETPRVLVLAEGDVEEARLDQWVIQGVRHISGIRPWGAYQAAKTIEAMVNKLGYSEVDAANALSVSVQRVKRSLRVLSALSQMAESDDYGEYSSPELYGYFDEIVKRPAVRKWLGWSDDSLTFENEDRAQQLYSWITPDDELEGRSRIPVAEGIRRLDDVLADPAALETLNTPGSTIDDAVRIAAPVAPPNWTEPLVRAKRALDTVPIGDLENLTEDDRRLIEELIELAKKRLEQADKFTS